MVATGRGELFISMSLAVEGVEQVLYVVLHDTELLLPPLSVRNER